MAGTSHLEAAFDKGLRGPPAEQLATVSTLSRLVQDNPIPTFVNSLIVRLANAFRDGSLDLRVATARALRQCGSHVKLAFSSVEISKRILKVSHSNDPNAREAVLDVLAELAPIIPECNSSHHLIRESLSTCHDGEFRATCHALKSFAAISHSFAESIILHIGKILEGDEMTEPRKVLVCSAFSTMSATTQVNDQVFGIAELILRRSISDEYFHAFLSSTTSLCIEIRYSIPKQIDLLLDLLNPSDINEHPPTNIRRLIILTELKRLARFTSIWTEEQVRILVESLSSSMSSQSLIQFFDATTSLVKNCSYPNLKLLKNLVVPNTGFGSHANSEVSVRFVYFAAQVVCSPRAFEEDSPEYIEATMTAFTVVVVNSCTNEKLNSKLASKLYRAVGDLLLTFPHTQYTFTPMIISALFSAFDSPIPEDRNQKERLEVLCRLSDSDKLYISEIHTWACSVMKENKMLFNAYPSQFSYLCFAVGTSLPPDTSVILYEECSVSMYETARSAFRNGQWKQVATPNLSRINMLNMPQFERNWITALREIGNSQLIEMSLDEMEAQQNHLLSALSALKTGKSDAKYGSTLRFPIGMVSAMLSSSYAYFHLLSVLIPFQTVLSGALQPDKFFNPVMAKRFLTALSSCESSLNDAFNEWTSLVRASFCADSTSFDLITLYYLRISVLQTAVKVILRKQSADTIIQIPQLSKNRTCSLFQRERLQWVIERIPYLRYDFDPNINTINNLHTIVEQLAISPYMLPRFFFQQFYHIDFKLSTTPRAEKDRPVKVMQGETNPIRVDGSLTSTHPSLIRSIIVMAEVVSLTSHSHNQEFKETVDLNENNHFTAQFLITFKTSCEVRVRIEFIDQTSRKQWKADGGAVIPITVREKHPPPVAHDFKRGGVHIPNDPRQMIRNSMFPSDMM
uniref:Integrator complex subunit 7 n=1 Tax=Caenorhabditis tropicalis TaxID=1561998 RepID=A0A1I7T227_9PELO